MGFSKLTLENFRSFKGIHEIELASINLFFGANSVGKSSIFKALHNFKRLGEEDVFKGESNASVTLKFDAPISMLGQLGGWGKRQPSYPPEISLLNVISEEEWATNFYVHFKSVSNSFFVKHGIKLEEVENEKVEVDYDLYGLNDIWLLELCALDGYSEFTNTKINLDHPIFLSHPSSPLKSYKKDFETLDQCLERLNGQDAGHVRYYISKLTQAPLSPVDDNDLDMLLHIIQDHLVEKFDSNYKNLHKSLPALLWILRDINLAMPNLRGMAHVGPLRKVPDQVKGRKIENNVRANVILIDDESSDDHEGDSAWQAIFESAQFDDSGYMNVPYIEEKPLLPLEKRVSDWLLNWFHTPHEIQFHTKFVYIANTEDKLRKLYAGELDSTELIPESARVVFRNIQNDSITTARDIGVGISQLTPVIVNALESSSFFVEQPELHIHPRMQTVLGDLFVFEGLYESTEGSGDVTLTTKDIDGHVRERNFSRKKHSDESFILVETHSEHLILRLLKRVREGILKPEDLAVYYFENDWGKTVSTRIHIDDEGEFTSPWPEGFFEERLGELF